MGSICHSLLVMTHKLFSLLELNIIAQLFRLARRITNSISGFVWMQNFSMPMPETIENLKILQMLSSSLIPCYVLRYYVGAPTKVVVQDANPTIALSCCVILKIPLKITPFSNASQNVSQQSLKRTKIEKKPNWDILVTLNIIGISFSTNKRKEGKNCFVKNYWIKNIFSWNTFSSTCLWCQC